jgi:hypothetical protein
MRHQANRLRQAPLNVAGGGGNDRLMRGGSAASGGFTAKPYGWAAALLGGAVAFASTSARADDLPAPRLVPELTLSKDKGVESAPAADTWTSRPRTINLQGGAPGSPIGVAGLSFEYAPIKYLVLGAGGGYSPDGGMRGAFMPRLRLPLSRRFAVGLGTPFALGPYQFTASQVEQCPYAGCSTGYRTTRTWTMAAWGHIEPNVELRVVGAVALRFYGGYAQLLNAQGDQCVSTVANGCPSRIGETKLYGGLALGYAW